MHSDTIEVMIDHLGGLGDGIGYYQDKPVFVPFTVPGDTIKAQITPQGNTHYQGHLLEILTAGEGRQSPPCPHFGKCGGCRLQHITPALYASFKQDILLTSIKRLGVSPSIVEALVTVGPQSRRRIEFKVAFANGIPLLGFFSLKSHHVVDIVACPVTEDAITLLIPLLKQLLLQLKKPAAIKAFHITRADNGLEVLVPTTSPLPPADREKIIHFAKTQGLLRISIKNGLDAIDVIYEKTSPHIYFEDISVTLPPGAFLQATVEGQKTITHAILSHTNGLLKIGDLYCGCGTYSLPLAQHGHIVSAYEGDHDMALALHNAIKRHPLANTLHISTRDLFKHPVPPTELNRWDAAIINPPRNGAAPQVQALANSTVKKIIMVSCNPLTFERDARFLLQGGYTLTHALPIDQFYWNYHLELVAVFERN